jgi:hypothetical protein
MTPAEKRRAARKAAMPEVKKLVRRYGRANIARCVMDLQAQEKTAKQIASLRKEAARLARSL